MLRSRLLAPLVVVLLGALPGHAAFGDNALGINVHLPHDSLHLVDKVADAGIQWIRVDGNWDLFEPVDVTDVPVGSRNDTVAYDEGAYQFDLMDRVVCKAHTRGLKVYMSLGYSPCWAQATPSAPPCGPSPPAAGKFDAMVFAVVRHYADGVDCGADGTATVTHFGMWNEANLDGFWTGTTVAYRDDVLVPGAAAVRAACPDCTVLGPDFAHVGEADTELETVLCNPAALASLDIIAHHNYHGFGGSIWDGDSYDNALDDQRFSFTRKSLYDILELCGATDREVWITETGKRADTDQAGDPSLAEQADYVTKVLEAQLARAWLTNTFIYEVVDDTTSDISGYGLWRCPQSPGGFGEPCFEKPAVQAIRDFLAEHPQFGPPTAQPACSNGDDDDGDALADFPADPGCADASDDDESNPPPVPTLRAPAGPALSLDAEGLEYDADLAVLLPSSTFVTPDVPTSAPNDADLSARVQAVLAQSGDAIAFFIEVTDDAHDNAHPAADLWQGDSVQLAFDPDGSGGSAYGVGDLEIGVALLGGTPTLQVFFGTDPGVEVAVVRDGNATRYELTVPSAFLFPGAGVLSPGLASSMSLLVNEADGSGREGWLEWAGGIGRFKRPDDFGRLQLVDASGSEGEGEGEGEGAGEGEGEGAGEGEGEGAGEGEGEGTGEGEGEGEPPDTTCGCASARSPRGAGASPALASLLALAAVTLRRRRR